MDFNQTLMYVFEDKQWVGKIVILTLLLLFATLPIIGLIPLAVALGFLIQLAANVRQGLPRPLPTWDDYGEKLILGSHVLFALVVYNLPLLMILLLGWFMTSAVGGLLGAISALCCVFPLTLGYTLVAWTLLAVGCTEFMDKQRRDIFFRLPHLWDIARTRRAETFRWLGYAFLVNFVAAFALIIPCCGQILVAALLFPIHGHLLGQFAHQLSIKNVPPR